jgi:uncharacterized membrane protein
VLIYKTRLIILENTLKLKILIKWNIRNESIKYYKHFNIINENAKKRSLNKDQVQDSLIIELNVLKRTLTSISQDNK